MVPKIVAAGDGELLEFDEWAAVIKIAAEESDGTVTVLETRHDPGEGADAHTHSRESEIFFVLEGQVTFTVGDALHEVGLGATVFGPVGTAHGFEVGPNGGRLLHVFVPSGMEGYFREMHAGKADDRSFPVGAMSAPAKAMAFAAWPSPAKPGVKMPMISSPTNLSTIASCSTRTCAAVL